MEVATNERSMKTFAVHTCLKKTAHGAIEYDDTMTRMGMEQRCSLCAEIPSNRLSVKVALPITLMYKVLYRFFCIYISNVCHWLKNNVRNCIKYIMLELQR